jgi:hypothetical protein
MTVVEIEKARDLIAWPGSLKGAELNKEAKRKGFKSFAEAKKIYYRYLDEKFKHYKDIE